MGPEEVDQRGVRIGFMVGMNMVNSVNSDPSRWGVLEAADTENCKRVFDPCWRFETAVGEQAMVADCDPLPEDVDPNQHGDEADPRKEVGDQSQQAKQVDNQNGP